MEYRQNKAGWQPRSPKIDAKKYEQDEETERSSFSSEMEVAKLSALPNLKVRFVSCSESAIKRWLSSELEETVFSLTHELFMIKHHTVTLTILFFQALLSFSNNLLCSNLSSSYLGYLKIIIISKYFSRLGAEYLFL